MALTTMYITNNPDVAKIAQKYGVDRIWVDLETLGKAERQKNIDSVKSHHTVSDIKKIVPLLTSAKMLVRVNPLNPLSRKEIDDVIAAGADMIMLPMWRSADDVKTFLELVNERVQTTLLLETKEAVESLDAVLELGGFDEIHIGLNDLHLSYHLPFMFQLLSNGVVEQICHKVRAYHVPYGFGGIARLGEGMVPAEEIIIEHYRLGSTRAILSRSFCNADEISNLSEINRIFETNMNMLRTFERKVEKMSISDFLLNKKNLEKHINNVSEKMRG